MEMRKTLSPPGTRTPDFPAGILITIPYLLIPWSRILLEKLTGFQLVKKFHACYGTRKFVTAVTSARHLSLF
jgi:hypothetical protein